MLKIKTKYATRLILPAVAIDSSATLAFINAVIPLCRFPAPDVVRQLANQQTFNTIRATGQRKRFEVDTLPSGQKVMFDDNTTPRLAFLWSHGCLITSHPTYREEDGTERSHYVFAHVWEVAQDIDSYTNVANIVAVPKHTASLTDGDGPLAPYFQYHTFDKYGWKPSSVSSPKMPEHYDVFRELVVYLESDQTIDPRVLIKNRGNQLNNERIRTMKLHHVFPWD
jgi:hypothetical protein